MVLALVLVVLVAFTALVVDIAEGRLAKNQLQIAADAAARAAIWQVPGNIAQATTDAQNIAKANACLGTPVVLDASENSKDIEFGQWSTTKRTFTPLSGSALQQANAVHITAHRVISTNFAAALKPSVETLGVSASAICLIVQGQITAGGVIGINSVNMNGTPNVDSYDSSAGPYNPANPGSSAVVLSNGDVLGNGVPTVHGSVVYGGTFSGIQVNPGPADPLSQQMVFPDVNSAPYQVANNNSQIATWLDAQRNLSLKGNDHPTVPAGTYYINNLSMTGNSALLISGPVTFYVTGSVNLSGTVSTPGNIPANFQIMVDGSGTVKLGGTSDLYAYLYAPQSAVTLTGTHDFYGGMIGSSLSMTGSSAIHADIELIKQNAPQVMLVQ